MKQKTIVRKTAEFILTGEQVAFHVGGRRRGDGYKQPARVAAIGRIVSAAFGDAGSSTLYFLDGGQRVSIFDADLLDIAPVSTRYVPEKPAKPATTVVTGLRPRR